MRRPAIIPPVLDAALTLPLPARVPPSAWVEIGRVRHAQWSPYALAVPGLAPKLAGLRVVHLTDLHLTPAWMPAFDRVHERLAASPPDLILVSGDFVDAKEDARPALPNLRRFLAGLKSRLGVYGILGNHDGDVLPVLVGDWPVRLMCNETVILKDADVAVEIVGLHGVLPADARRAIAAIGPKPPGTLRLVMTHFPQHITALAGRADAVFTGHTHGGQICLPGGWPPITHDPLPRRFSRGVHRVDGTWFLVGRGMGFSTYPVRAFCPAEAIEVTFGVTDEPRTS